MYDTIQYTDEQYIFTITVITIEFGVVRVCAFCVLQEILQKQSVPLRKKSKVFRNL